MLIEFLETMAAGAIGGLISAYLSAYISQKGKNKADQEDIEKITDLIENTKRIHQEILEKLKAKNSLRNSIIEKRLVAHQEAYDLCRKVNSLYHAPDKKDEFWHLILEISKWWGNNCLFLDDKPRKAFLAAWVAAKDFECHLDSKDFELITESRKTIWKACQIIEESVELPPIKIEEIEQAPNPYQP